MRIVAVDIGGTTIKVAEILEDGTITSFKEVPTEAKKGGPHVVEKVKTLIGEMSGYEKIGISTAGQVNFREGSIQFANENIPHYTGVQLKAILEETFKVPVVVENDVNAAALGEAHYGGGRDYNDFLCLTYGTGIGGAIIINRQVYRGANGVAGEFGHMISHPEGIECACGSSGCYEQYGSTTALIREVKKVDPTCENGRILFKKIQEGDERLKKVLDKWMDEIILGLIQLIHVFNPSCIVLGGGIMEQDIIIEGIRKKLPEHIMPSYREVVIKKAELGNKAGILGATYHASKMG